MLKRVAVLSDIHGNLPALQAVVEDLQGRQVQAVFNLGDHISGPLWPLETLHYLMAQDWIQIAGNHDRQLLQVPPAKHIPSDRHAFQFLKERELDWLETLPASLLYQDTFLLCHGAPDNDLTYLLESIEGGHNRLASRAEIKARLGSAQAPLILCGHSHVPRVVQLANNCLLVNPGSVGLQAYADDSPAPHEIENGSPHARYTILEHQDLHWAVEWIAVAYDFDKAAAQARQNRRPDWATALQSGFAGD